MKHLERMLYVCPHVSHLNISSCQNLTPNHWISWVNETRETKTKDTLKKYHESHFKLFKHALLETCDDDDDDDETHESKKGGRVDDRASRDLSLEECEARQRAARTEGFLSVRRLDIHEFEGLVNLEALLALDTLFPKLSLMICDNIRLPVELQSRVLEDVIRRDSSCCWVSNRNDDCTTRKRIEVPKLRRRTIGGVCSCDTDAFLRLQTHTRINV